MIVEGFSMFGDILGRLLDSNQSSSKTTGIIQILQKQKGRTSSVFGQSFCLSISTLPKNFGAKKPLPLQQVHWNLILFVPLMIHQYSGQSK